MGEWESTTLGTLFDPIREVVAPSAVPESRFVGMEHMISAEPRIHDWGYADKVSSPSPAFQTGDILFGRLRPYLRKVALAHFDGICSGEILVWRPRLDKVRPEFLQYLAASDRVINYAIEKSAGSRMPRVSSSDLAATPVVVPPLEDQDRIVQIVGVIEEGLHRLGREAASLRALYEAFLERLWFETDGDTAPLRRLGDLMELSITRVRLVDSETYRLAGVLNAGQGLIDKGAFRGDETDYVAMNLLKTDQVIMRKLTAWEGPIAVVGKSFDGFVSSNEFPTFTLTGISPAYFAHVCRTERLRHEMRRRVTGSVQRRKRLNPDQLLAVELPVPQMAVQEVVASHLDSIVDCQKAIQLEESRLRAVRSRVLSLLLNGELAFRNELHLSQHGRAA